MADTNSPLNITQKIVLEIEERLKNVGAAVKHLSSVSTTATTAQKSLGAYSSSSAHATKAMGTMQTAAFNLGKALKVALSELMLVVDALKLIAAVSIGAFSWMSNAGKELTALAAQTGKGSQAISNLRDAYEELKDSGQTVTVSLREIAESIGSFANQGFAQLQMSAEKSTQKFIATLQNALVKGLGDSKAGEGLFHEISGGFKDNLVALESFRDAWLEAGSDIRKQQQVLIAFRWVDETVMTKAIGAIENYKETLAGSADPAVQATIKWNEVVNQLKAVWADFTQQFILTFGNDLTGALDTVKEGLSGAMEMTGEWIDYLKTASQYITVVSKWASILSGNPLGALVADSADKAQGPKKSYDEIHGGRLAKQKEAADKAKQIADSAKTLKTELPLDKYASINKEIADINTKAKVLMQHTENWSKQLEMSSKSLNIVAELIGLVGNKMKVGGKDIESLLVKGFEQSVLSAQKLTSETEKALDVKQQEIEKIKTKISLEGNTDANQMQLNKALGEEADLQGKILQARKAIDSAQDQRLAGAKVGLEQASMLKELDMSRLEISKQLYGTLALGVQAVQGVVDKIIQEKEALEKMIALQKDSIDFLERTKAGEDQIWGAKKRLIDLETKHNQKIAEQLGMLKELRDGYLNAVQAQVFGAGKFEKIIVTNEKNLAISIEKGIVKKNYLLGQVGKDAQRANKAPIRFSPTGQGALTSDGKTLTGDEMNQYIKTSIENVGDPEARKIMQSNTEALQGLNNSLSSYANEATKRSAVLGVGQGNINMPGLEGEAVRKISGGQATTTSSKGSFTTGGSWSQKAERMASNLESVAKDMREFGPAIDEIESENSTGNRSHPGIRGGNFIP